MLVAQFHAVYDLVVSEVPRSELTPASMSHLCSLFLQYFTGEKDSNYDRIERKSETISFCLFESRQSFVRSSDYK